MAEKPRKDKKKKTRRRKIRRDVDVSSSESEPEEMKDKKASSEEQESDSDVDMEETTIAQTELENESQAEDVTTESRKEFSESEFTSWYLRQVTKELEEDLDKIRSASDFKDSSLPILISALQQGASLFSNEEKQRIMGSA